MRSALCALFHLIITVPFIDEETEGGGVEGVDRGKPKSALRVLSGPGAGGGGAGVES